MKRRPSLFLQHAAFAAHAFGDEDARTLGGQTIPVGWNWMNSMSISSAPARYASAWPSPVPSQLLLVIL